MDCSVQATHLLKGGPNYYSLGLDSYKHFYIYENGKKDSFIIKLTCLKKLQQTLPYALK